MGDYHFLAAGCFIYLVGQYIPLNYVIKMSGINRHLYCIIAGIVPVGPYCARAAIWEAIPLATLVFGFIGMFSEVSIPNILHDKT